MKLRIHSGGQTGADLAGLWVGKVLGLPTGGTAPQGYLTLDGHKPALHDLFGLKAWGDYRTRTIKNVRDSDVTLVFSRKLSSPGTVLTINACLKYKKPYFVIPDNRGSGESLQRYWGDLLSHDSERTKGWTSAVGHLMGLAKQNQRLGIDDYYIINVAGNATKNAPESFEFAFVGLWVMLLLYSKGLATIGLPSFTDGFEKVNPVKLAAKLKDKFEDVDLDLNP